MRAAIGSRVAGQSGAGKSYRPFVQYHFVKAWRLRAIPNLS
nr:MAG TPA: Helicase HerA, central domain [Caudoviricetes sp.]